MTAKRSKNIEHFIDFQIEDMKSYPDYARTEYQLSPNDPVKTREWWIRWTEENIEGCYREGYGTIEYLKIWTKSISEKTADELKTKLREARWDAKKRTREEIR